LEIFTCLAVNSTSMVSLRFSSRRGIATEELRILQHFSGQWSVNSGQLSEIRNIVDGAEGAGVTCWLPPAPRLRVNVADLELITDN